MADRMVRRAAEVVGAGIPGAEVTGRLSDDSRKMIFE